MRRVPSAVSVMPRIRQRESERADAATRRRRPTRSAPLRPALRANTAPRRIAPRPRERDRAPIPARAARAGVDATGTRTRARARARINKPPESGPLRRTPEALKYTVRPAAGRDGRDAMATAGRRARYAPEISDVILCGSIGEMHTSSTPAAL